MNKQFIQISFCKNRFSKYLYKKITKIKFQMDGRIRRVQHWPQKRTVCPPVHVQCTRSLTMLFFLYNKMSEINKRKMLYISVSFLTLFIRYKKYYHVIIIMLLSCPKNNNKRNDKMPYKIFVILKQKIYITESKSFIPISSIYRIGHCNSHFWDYHFLIN